MAHVPSRIRRKIEGLFRHAEAALLPDAVLAAEAAHIDPAAARAELVAGADDVALVGAEARLAQLTALLDSRDANAIAAYVAQHGACGVARFHTSFQTRTGTSGTRIYMMSVETFPDHINNVYVIAEDDSRIMLDCGSGFPSSLRDMALRFAVIRALFHEDIHYEALDFVVVSHAHLDHFGGANHVKRTTRARLAVHELDARVLACFDERLVVVAKDLDVFWRRAGVSDDERTRMLTMYIGGKKVFAPQEVDRHLRDGDKIGPGYVVHHVPGHCPGLICLQVHDVLLTSDHVLARITPHQYPQAITPFSGLEHYFHSLAKIRRLDGINLTLGGHEEPIWDLRARCDAIALFHRERLAKTLEACAEPRSIAAVTETLFGAQEGYGRLLALEEAGAHVEYLHDLGRLRIANLDDVARSRDPVIEYVVR